MKRIYKIFPLCLFVAVLLMLSPQLLKAQTDSTAKEAEAKPEEEMISPSLELVSVQKSDKSVELRATMKTKIKGTFYNLYGMKISFVQVNDTAEKKLGFVITDDYGKAILALKPEAVIPAPDGKLNYKAVFAGNKKMDPADAEISVKRAYIEVTPVKEDSVYTVKAKLVVPGNETDSSVKDLTIGIFVKRSINPLKIGEGTTDESGEAAVEITPTALPGDDKGNLTLLARLDDNETFGNLESAVVQQWGVPVSEKVQKEPRALWSSHPPLWMLITFIVLMVVVWGHYFVIVFQLFKLRKEEPAVQ